MPRLLPAAAPRAGWLSGIDGLRALAVVGVVAYHFLPNRLHGGFLGVDLFFVISGFVITTLLLREINQHQRIDVVSFYRRRARRLLPALVLLVVGVSIASLSYWQDARADLLPSAASSLFLCANWWLIGGDRSYFVESGRPPLLQHLWSLAVEEQFYLLWPVIAGLILGGTLMLRGKPIVLRPRALHRLALASLLLGCLSTAAMAILAVRDDVPYGHDSARIYFGTDTHGMGLLFGAAVATLGFVRSLPGARRRRILRGAFVSDVLAVAGLTVLVHAAFTADEFSPALYRTGFGTYSLVAAVVVGCVVRPGSLVAMLLERPIFTWVGRRSYSIYLWHWPIAALTRPEVDLTWSPTAILGLRVTAVVLLAEISYRFVEQPIRTGQLQRWLARRLPTERRRRLKSRLIPAVALSGLLVVTSLGSAWAYSSPASSAVASVAVLSPAPAWVGTSPTPGGMQSPTLFQSPSYVELSHVPGAASGIVRMHTSSANPSAAGNESSSPSPGPVAPPVPVAAATPQVMGSPVGSIPDVVSAFGDSVMLGAAPALRTVMPNVDVHAIEGRQARAVFGDVEATKAAGRLAPQVVIHAGDNGIMSAADLTATLSSLSDRVRVVVITDRVAKSWQDPNNATMIRICVQYPNVVLADWHSLSNGQPSWFYRDGLHVKGLGAARYAAMVLDALTAPAAR